MKCNSLLLPGINLITYHLIFFAGRTIIFDIKVCMHICRYVSMYVDIIAYRSGYRHSWIDKSAYIYIYNNSHTLNVNWDQYLCIYIYIHEYIYIQCQCGINIPQHWSFACQYPTHSWWEIRILNSIAIGSLGDATINVACKFLSVGLPPAAHYRT